MDLAIDADRVTKLYGDSDDGVRDVTVGIKPGAIVGLVGPSGAGKTTIVRLVAGLHDRDSGELTVLGEDPSRFSAATRKRIGYLPQGQTLYPNLSLRENVDFVASLFGMRGKVRGEAVSRVLDAVELGDVGERRFGDLSGGMARRGALAAALVHRPEMAVLDEPTSGLDPILRQQLWNNLEAFSSEGRTLLVTTQNVNEAAYCQAVILISDGRIVQAGTPEKLRAAAFDGELVDVAFSSRPSWEAVDRIAQSVDAANTVFIDHRSVRFAVPDAGSAIPRIGEEAQQAGLEVTEAERHIPEFDDVFIRLVEQSRQEVEA